MGLFDGITEWAKRLWDNKFRGEKDFTDAFYDMYHGLGYDIGMAYSLTKEQEIEKYGDDRTWVSRYASRVAKDLQQEVGGLVGKPMQSAMEVPVVGGALRAYDEGFTRFVRKPLTRSMLLASDADATGMKWGDEDVLDQAWEDAARVTPGQAVAFNAAQLFGVVSRDELEEYDPRTEEGRKHYYDDPLFQYTSGIFDFGLAFVDPLKGAGKGARLATLAAAGSDIAAIAKPATKLALATKVAPTAKMVEKGFHEKELFGTDAQLGQSLEEAGSSSKMLDNLYESAVDNRRDLATYQRIHFNDFAFGGTVATASWMAAQLDKGVFADVLLASRGSREAMARVQSRSMDIAGVFGRGRQALNIPTSMEQYATQAAAKKAIDGGTDVQLQAWVQGFGRELENITDDAFKEANKASFWYGLLNSTVGQGKIRTSILAKMRVGVHNHLMSTPVSVSRGADLVGRNVNKFLRNANPSARYDNLINVEAAASVRNFRYNVDHLPVAQAVKDDLIKKYMLSAGAVERSHWVKQADETAAIAMGHRYNLTQDEVYQLIDEMSNRRQAALGLLRNSPTHIPTEFRKEAEAARLANRKGDAARAEAYAKVWTQMIDEGVLGPVVNKLPSTDRAYLGIVDEGPSSGFRADQPMMQSTTANLMPMMDYAGLDNAFRRELAPLMRTQKRMKGIAVKDPNGPIADILSSQLWKQQANFVGALKSMQSVWSVVALLRPMQVVRTLADDGLRSGVWHGATPYMLTGMNGVMRSWARMRKQGIPAAKLWANKRVARLAGRKVDLETPNIDISDVRFDAPPELASEVPGFYQLVPAEAAGGVRIHRDDAGVVKAVNTRHLEAGLTSGLIDLDTYIGAMARALPRGKTPMALVAIKEQLEGNLITREQFRARVAEYVMDQSGRSAYTNGVWQSDFYDSVEALSGKGPNAGIISDPRDGGFKEVGNLYDTHEMGPTYKVVVSDIGEPRPPGKRFASNQLPPPDLEIKVPRKPPVMQRYRFEDLGDFLNDHADLIVDGRYQVHGRRTDGGHFQVTLVRSREAPRTVAERMTPQQRRMVQDGLTALGHDDVRMNLNGAPVRLSGVFAGLEGDWLKTTSASSNMAATAYESWRALKETTRQKIVGANVKTVKPDDPTYPQSWEYTVNRLVANDPVQQLTLQGQNFSEILEWTRNEKTGGPAWVRSRQQGGVGVEEQIEALMSMANRWVPDVGDLRKRVLTQTAKYEDLQRIIGADKDMWAEVRELKKELKAADIDMRRFNLEAKFKLRRGEKLDRMMNRKKPRYPQALRDEAEKAGMKPKEYLGTLSTVERQRLIGATLDEMQPKLDELLRAKQTRLDVAQQRHQEALAGVEGNSPLDFHDALGNEDQYALGIMPIQEHIRRATQKWFKWFSDMPTDKLVRHPFINEEYERLRKPMVDNYIVYLKREGKPGTQADIDQIEHIARQQALDVTQNVLFDTMGRYDVAAGFQSFMPFANAIADATFKWARIAWKKPYTTAHAWMQYLKGPEHMGLVYDQDGSYLQRDEDGNERWINPLTGEEISEFDKDGKTPKKHEKIVLMRLPKVGGKQLLVPGQTFIPAFHIESMNPILGWPSAGPIVGIPANAFLMDKPRLADNWLVKHFVLPFGTTDDSVLQQAAPGLVRSAMKWFGENQDLAGSTAWQILAMQNVEYARGDRLEAPNLDEAKAEARELMWLRFGESGLAPVTLQYWSPYKMYQDYYHMLVEKHGGDENKATLEFRQVAGDDYLWMTAHVTKTNTAMPATLEAFDSYQKNKALIEEHPELSMLILGGTGAGSYNAAVYEYTKTLRIKGKPVREIMPIEESFDQMRARADWSEYSAMMDDIDAQMEQRGLSSLRDFAALDLAARKEQWVDEHRLLKNKTDVSPWFKEYSTMDRSYMESRLLAMKHILSNTALVEARPDLQGLQRYLDEREQVVEQMQHYGYATLDSKKAQWLADEWDDTVWGLKGDLQFSALYNRWLDRDTLARTDGEVGDYA